MNSQNEKEITLVIPNYNHAAYLPESLGNILKQSLKAHKIIIIDDASTDDSVQIIQNIIRNDKRVELIKHEHNMGCIATLNEGLNIAKTEFIAFPGADDSLNLSFLEEYIRLIQTHPEAAFCVGSGHIINNKSKIIGHRPIFYPSTKASFITSSHARLLFKKMDNFLLAQTAVYRRSYLLSIGGLNPALDFLADGMAMRELALKHGFCFMPKPLAAWRYLGSNKSIQTITNSKYLERLLVNLGVYFKNQPCGIYPKHYAQLFERRLRFGSARLQITMATAFTDAVLFKLYRTLKVSSNQFFPLKLIAKLPFKIAKITCLGYSFLLHRPFSVFLTLQALLKLLVDSNLAIRREE